MFSCKLTKMPKKDEEFGFVLSKGITGSVLLIIFRECRSGDSCFGKRPRIYSVVDGLSKFPWKRCGK